MAVAVSTGTAGDDGFVLGELGRTDGGSTALVVIVIASVVSSLCPVAGLDGPCLSELVLVAMTETPNASTTTAASPSRASRLQRPIVILPFGDGIQGYSRRRSAT
jgi:hypothetical protein